MSTKPGQAHNDDGTPKASYGYRPYGDPDTELTKGDVTLLNPTNPYRYSGRRLDPGSETYDMGARRFGADTSRFLQRDLFLGTIADLSLTLDPLTANRYTLAAGNPVSYAEWDGHMVSDDSQGNGSLNPGPLAGGDVGGGVDGGGRLTFTAQRERGASPIESFIATGYPFGSPSVRSEEENDSPDLPGICTDQGSGDSPMSQLAAMCNFLVERGILLGTSDGDTMWIPIVDVLPGIADLDDEGGLSRKSRSELLGESGAGVSAARRPVGRLTWRNFRRNLIRLTGRDPGPAVEAHHVFPVKFEGRFRENGINIHDPRFGAWWERGAHRRFSTAYNEE